MNQYFGKYISISPLVNFRIFFGILMILGTIRFCYNGWIDKLYINPSFHFHYQGFNWVKDFGEYTYILFLILLICSIGITISFFYKTSISIFFIVFTYIELIDKTTYLNHYYFISIISFVLIFLPANRLLSFDVYLRRISPIKYIPRYNIDVLKILIAIVYVYAGLAKLNYDWLLQAMPLSLWLPSKFNFAFFDNLMHSKFIHYAFSWAGMLFDTFIIFFLINKKTRIASYLLIIFFHVLTALLFPIGMFPYIMMGSVLLFFSPGFHDKILSFYSIIIPNLSKQLLTTDSLNVHEFWARAQKVLLSLILISQLLIPWRYLLQDGNIFWNEMGYRFSWRVMLMEKTGIAEFKIVDSFSKKQFTVNNADFLTPFQEKQMSTQVDFIIEYAHYLAKHFENDGHENIEVYVESYVSLNARRSQVFVLPNTNLLNYTLSSNYNSILAPLNEK